MGYLKWIWDNLTQIKDILWIFFTLIATVVTVLTYKRAKHSILQPLRTEVIKRQTEILVEIITFFADETKFWLDLDISSIVNINAYYALKTYGYLLENDNELEKAYEPLMYCSMIVKKDEKLDSVKVVQTFEDKSEESKKNNIKKELYEKLEDGEIDLEMIHLTESYYNTMNHLTALSENPFLPKVIKEPMDKIITNIVYDLKITLKEELEQFILSVYKRSQEGNVDIQFVGIYNQFNRKRRDNQELIKQINLKTREYLMIDKKW